MLILDELGGLSMDDVFTEGIVQELVFLAENRKDMHIILVGYDEDIRGFLEQNIGLRSRFSKVIHISDYSAEELVDIGIGMLKNHSYTFDEEETRKILQDCVKRMMDIPDYGNARAMRSLVGCLTQVKAAEYERKKVLNMSLSRQELDNMVQRYFDGQPEVERQRVIGF